MRKRCRTCGHLLAGDDEGRAEHRSRPGASCGEEGSTCRGVHVWHTIVPEDAR